MQFSRLMSLVLCVSLSLLPPIVYAETKPTVVVPPLAGATSDRARTSLIKALRATGKVSVVEASAVETYLKDRQSPGVPSQRESGNAQVLKQGIQAYRGLKIQSALKLLDQAKLGFRKNLLEEGAFEGLRAAQFYLAMCYLANKDRTRAKEELVNAVILDPERKNRKLSSKLYSAEVRGLYDDARRDVERKDHGDLAIDSKSPGELVYVDGKAFGVTPVRITNLPVGEHFVRVEAEGKDPHFSAITLTSGENRLNVELKTLRQVDMDKMFSTVHEASDLDHQRVAFLDEMGLALGADLFVLLAPEEAAVRAQLYDQRSQEVSPIDRERSPEALAQKLVTHIDRDGYVVNSAATEPPAMSRGNPLPAARPDLTPPPGNIGLSEQIKQAPPTPERLSTHQPWYENKWIWIAVGSGLAVGGASVLLFTDIGKKNPSSSTLTVTVPGK